MTNLAKVILEDQGYRVTLKNADIAPIFTSVASGKADVFMDAWLPVTHADYMEQYGDRLETLGTVYEHAKLGLVVPEYVTIRSIEDLNAHQDQFKGKNNLIISGCFSSQARADRDSVRVPSSI